MCIFILPGIHIVQDLQFMIGQQQAAAVAAVSDGQPMATISKVSRGHYAPQQFTSVREWFHYAFSSIENKGKRISLKDTWKLFRQDIARYIKTRYRLTCIHLKTS